MTQNEMVLKYLKDFGSISSFEAFSDLGITRLSARISELKASGVNIMCKTEHSKNRYGKETYYSRYFCAE